MSLKHLIGLDHLVVPVRNLDTAADAWRAAGFTVSPRGKHSDYMGTANHTMVFGHDYIELMGIDRETPNNQSTVAFLERREGIERAAFTTDDAAGLAEELRARHQEADGPLAFSRPVPLPDGGHTEARFQVTSWPVREAPAGLRIFACQHLTREAVWIPQLQQHANGACGLVRVEVIAEQPQAAATQLAQLIDQPVQPNDGAFRVPSGPGRAAIEFCDRDVFSKRYPAEVREGAAGWGAAAVVIASNRLEQARALPGAVAHAEAVSLPPARMTGVVVSFVAA